MKKVSFAQILIAGIVLSIITIVLVLSISDKKDVWT
jgi:hypothetical protein